MVFVRGYYVCSLFLLLIGSTRTAARRSGLSIGAGMRETGLLLRGGDGGGSSHDSGDFSGFGQPQNQRRPQPRIGDQQQREYHENRHYQQQQQQQPIKPVKYKFQRKGGVVEGGIGSKLFGRLSRGRGDDFDRQDSQEREQEFRQQQYDPQSDERKQRQYQRQDDGGPPRHPRQQRRQEPAERVQGYSREIHGPRNKIVDGFLSSSPLLPRIGLSLSSLSLGALLSLYIAPLFSLPLVYPPKTAVECVTATAFPLFMLLLTFLEGHFGDLARALSLALLFSLKRFPRIRVRYATWPHVRSSLFLGKRMPFPPGVENPFSYRRREGPISRDNPR